MPKTLVQDARPGVPLSRRDPFNPPRGVIPPSRPIAKPEEGARRNEGLAAIGAGLLVLGAAALISWLLYLALG
ncbi:hypothetical protein [Falsiroseomonas selenitidurans]|uniref:Uncharacterized protein n=1 Tax=Falsiroseomonas selenitidurans TaxID=2716335 RepID=A0ABX1E5H1_9PROT|nr:hypothetical protein [Falsiroseomonas selenitidurans]NKC32449.1 hypothetical protein [Falsiroseomonas selenitidurans]